MEAKGEAKESTIEIDLQEEPEIWQVSIQNYNEIYRRNRDIPNKDVQDRLHRKVATLQQLHETLRHVFDSGIQVFIRWTPSLEEDIERGFSKHLDGVKTEAGISVNELVGTYEKFGNDVINDRIDLAKMIYWYDKRYRLKNFREGNIPESNIYLLTGNVVGHGSDREPLLDASSIKVISEVDRAILREACLVSGAAQINDHPNNRQSEISHEKEKLKESITLAYGTGEHVEKSILAQFPEILDNKVLVEQRAKTLEAIK